MTSKRNPEDILALLEEEATDPEVDRALALSETERRREIESAGARLAVLHAEADRMYTSFLQEEEDRTARMKHSHAQVRTLRKPVWQRRSAIVVAGFAVAACVALAAMRFLSPPSVATPTPTPSRRTMAAALRGVALDACARDQWRACLDGLDAARTEDPAGEDLVEVQRARRAAREALAAQARDAQTLDRP
jgi:hypothetical protein